MQKSLKIIKESSLIVLSFLIPFVVLIIIFNTHHLALSSYDNLTMIMIDMQSEYIAYLRNLREILISGDSLIYINTKVLGGDYLSIYTFYLSSPFNFFVVFFKQEAIPLFFIWSCILKMSIASLNFYLFARFTSRFTYQKIVIAIGYGLISYSFIYMSNYMWLDGVMILPLVILGLHFIKEKKHYWLYPLAIGYSLMTSWYIGFMICVFSVLYFFCLFAKYYEKKKPENWLFLLRFAVFSLLGGFISSTYWLTAFIHLSGTKGFSEIPPFKMFSLSSLFSGFLENNYALSNIIKQYNSYISMFVGVVPLVFAITFFANNKFSIRERIALGALIAFYLILSSNTVGAALLHGAKEPTWFPGRYSFIIGFIVCVLAYRSLDESHEIHPIAFILPTIIGIVVIFIVTVTKHSEMLERYKLSVPSTIMYFVTIAFATLVSFINRIPKDKFEGKTIRKLLPHALLLLLFVEVASVYRGGDKVIRENVKYNEYQKYETYLKDDSYTKYFDLIKQYNKYQTYSPFYRMEATFNRDGNYNRINNNPMFYSYNGLSNFSSSSKKDVESYMGKIGFHYNGFFTKYQGGSTYAINSLLGIRYLFEDKLAAQNIHPYFLDSDTFEEINLDSKYHYYYNPLAINLGFASDKNFDFYVNEGCSVGDETYWYDHFEYQNEIFREINRSIDKDIFYPLEEISIVTNLEYDEDAFGIRTYHNAQPGNSIVIKYQLPEHAKDFPLYFSEKDNKEDLNYFVDSRHIELNTYWNKGIYSISNKGSTTHTVRIIFKEAMENATIRPELYYENLNVLKEYLSALKTQEFVVTKINNSLFSKSYKGEINIIDNNKEMIFTLPHENGIKVYVDGKKMKTYTRLNIFTAIDLSKVEKGEHNVTIKYADSGLIAAFPLCIISLLGFVPLVIFYDKIEKMLLKAVRKEK